MDPVINPLVTNTRLFKHIQLLLLFQSKYRTYLDVFRLITNGLKKEFIACCQTRTKGGGVVTCRRELGGGAAFDIPFLVLNGTTF